MFKNLDEFMSTIVLFVICIYAFKLFVWCLTYQRDNNNVKKGEFRELFINYIDNEDD